MTNKRIKNIAYITGTRADFGLMQSVLEILAKHSRFNLAVYATGMHLMPQFGNTVALVKKTFPNCQIVRSIFKNDDRSGISAFCADFTAKITRVLQQDRPDFILTAGDRPEVLCVALVCLYLGIPVGHIHGGDVTLTVDGTARHAITKLSSLHFPATKRAAERIRKMGEEAWRINTVGAPALDVIANEKLLKRKELFRALGIPYFTGKFLLFIQHPYYEDGSNIEEQFRESLAAIKSFNLPVVVIYPNADPGGRKIIKLIDKEKNNPLFHSFSNVTYKYFLALEREAAVIVGNSSAALIEAASFHTPVVNVGWRERDRERGKNVIDAPHEREKIKQTIQRALYDRRFLASLKTMPNPWGDGKAGSRIIKKLENLRLDEKLLSKRITY